jgi:hypothetical protein
MFSKKLKFALLVLVIGYAFCLELCAREDAALVVLGAGAYAKLSAIAAMLTLVLLRLVLFVFMPGYLAAKLALRALAKP